MKRSALVCALHSQRLDEYLAMAIWAHSFPGLPGIPTSACIWSWWTCKAQHIASAAECTSDVPRTSVADCFTARASSTACVSMLRLGAARSRRGRRLQTATAKTRRKALFGYVFHPRQTQEDSTVTLRPRKPNKIVLHIRTTTNPPTKQQEQNKVCAHNNEPLATLHAYNCMYM